MATVLVGLSCCATTQDQIDQAGDVVIACLQQRAPLLDDGKSDVITIAHAIVTACRGYIRSQAQLGSQGTGDFPHAERQFSDASLKLATEIVLQNRTGSANTH
jgi:F420-0:gamma-glutamyl ligase